MQNAECRMQNAKLIGAFLVLHFAFCILHSPEAYAGSQVTAKTAALSTAHPLATKVGLSVLQRGGNAIDASVAVAFALAVVHPQAGNLGGGGFLVYYDAATRGVWTLDFREVAPLAATRDMFAKNNKAARTGALAVAVPGTVAGLEEMHRKFGSMAWKDLVGPSIVLAKEPLRVDEELARDLETARRERGVDVPVFFENGKPRTRVAQADLVSTLQRVSVGGAHEFYEGDLAKMFVEGLRNAGGNIGFRDLREYKALWRAPIKLSYGAYDLYTVPPPSGGGLVIGEVLNMLADDDLAALGFQSIKALHLLAEAERRAYMDRNKYLGDPVSARIPYRELLSKKRADAWRKSINLERVIATVGLTEPDALIAEGEHTTHFTIADARGNIAAVTTSLGENFGSGVMLPGLGFFLNNAMDDFTTAPDAANRDGLVQGAVNSVEPAKRIATSMSPTIILRDNRPFLALGTRGGPSIPTTILQVFLNVAVYGKSLAAAVAAPRWHQQDVPEELFFEKPLVPKSTLSALNAMGHAIGERDAIGDVHAILFDKGRMIAVADPRRGGAAGGF